VGLVISVVVWAILTCMISEEESAECAERTWQEEETVSRLPLPAA
jgi:hypothetical protein